MFSMLGKRTHPSTSMMKRYVSGNYQRIKKILSHIFIHSGIVDSKSQLLEKVHTESSTHKKKRLDIDSSYLNV